MQDAIPGTDINEDLSTRYLEAAHAYRAAAQRRRHLTTFRQELRLHALSRENLTQTITALVSVISELAAGISDTEAARLSRKWGARFYLPAISTPTHWEDYAQEHGRAETLRLLTSLLTDLAYTRQ